MIHRNMMLTKNGDIWAYYKTNITNVTSGDADKKEEHKRKLSAFVEQLEPYKDFHMEMYPRQVELDKINAELEKDFDPTTEKTGKYYNGETERILKKELNAITNYTYMIGVKLKSNIFESDDTKSMIQNSIATVTDQLLNLLNLSRDMEDDFFDRFEESENELYHLVASFQSERISEDELVYLNRYNFIRDMEHSMQEESEKRGIYNITNGLIDPTKPGYLKITTPEGERWLAHVVIDRFGANMDYSHIFERAQRFSFPVEFHIKAQFKDKDKTIRKSRSLKTRVNQMSSEKRSTGESADDRSKKAKYLLDRLENQLDSGNKKFLDWIGSFVVTGATLKECKRRAEQVKRTMARRKIYCVQPVADQLQLFYKFLQGQSLQAEKHWVQKTTQDGFAETMYGVSQRLGNNAGFYLGRINRFVHNRSIKESVASSRDVVFFHPFVANKGIPGAMTDSPHISITGQTGKGKSFLVKMLLMFLAILKVKTLYIDPKTELEGWFREACNDPVIQEKYPMFVKLLESFNYVNLNVDDEESHGVLDPLVMLQGADAKDTAQDIIEQMYNLDDKDDVKRVLLRTLTEVIAERASGVKVGFMHVIERLRDSQDKVIRDAGGLLYEQIHGSVLQLIFSHGDVEGLNMDAKVNILGIKGLDLPEEGTDPKYFSDREKKSLALMIPLAKFCELFGARNNKEETVEIFDEGWMLTSTRIGKKLIKAMRRVGRSFNNALILVTQSVRDVNTKDDNGNFGVNFAFDESSERKDILRFLNLEVEEKTVNANEELLGNMIKGECLFKDIYGRTGKLAVDCLFEEWMLAFKTMDETNASKAEKQFA